MEPRVRSAPGGTPELLLTNPLAALLVAMGDEVRVEERGAEVMEVVRYNGSEYIDLPDAKHEEHQGFIYLDMKSPEILEILVEEGSVSHITRETVRALIPHLQAFVDTGSLVVEEPK